MKALKIFALLVGGLVVLGAILVAVALMPSVQTWVVRKAVADQPGADIQVSKVAAGFSGAEVADLKYVKDGMVVTAKSITAKYSAWDYITNDRINADSVTIDGLVIDLRNTTPAAASASGTTAPASTKSGGSSGKQAPSPAPEAAPKPGSQDPFEGLLAEAKLPFDVRVASVSANGRALLPKDQVVTFDLKGSGIETGQRGKLEWTIDFADSTAGAALKALRASGNAAVRIASDRRIDFVEVETIAAAMGPNLPADQIKLAAKAERPAGSGNESYVASVSLVKGNAVEPIFKTDAQFVAASREIAGAWDVTLRKNQLAGILAGFGLPEFDASGSGKYRLNPNTNAVAASGDLQASTTQLEKIAPALAAIGGVQLKTTFDGGLAGNIARLDQLNLEITGAEGRKLAQINSLQKIAYQLTEKRVTLADPKAELARISLQSLPLAWAQAFVEGLQIESGDLSMVLAVEAEADGSRVRARSVEPLAIRTVTIRQGDKTLADRVTLTARPSIDYSATKLNAELADLNVSMPAGDALGGNLSADVTNLTTTPAVAFAAQLQAKVINALKPYLPVETGPLSIALNVEGRHEGDILQLAKATANVNRTEGGALLTSLELQQPVRADLKAATFTVPNPTNTAARVRLGEIPLAWAETFVEKSKLSGSVTGGTLDVAMRSAEDVTLTTAEPLTLRAVTVTMDAKPMLQNVDLLASLTATKRGETIAYEVRKVEVKQGEALLAALTVAGEAKLGARMTVVAKGNLEADAAALMNQPALAAFATLSRGRVAAVFEANVADSTQAKAAISAKNLIAKQDNRALGDLELTLTANVKPDGSGTVSAPLTLTNGTRKSDLSINGTFGKAANKETFLFTGKVASNQLVADDFQPLAALAPASEKPKSPQTPAGRDSAPFWAGVNGKLELDLKRVLYGKDYVVSGVHGVAVITDSKLSLDGLEGKFKENPFKLAAGVSFVTQQPKPYVLTGSVNVAGLEVGEILRAANPNEKPALESRVSVMANLNGNGENVADLFKNVYGQFDVQGTQGVLRALGRKGGQAVSAVSSIVGIIGAARGSNTTMAISELASTLAEMRFENFSMRVERGADLNLKLSSLEFISPIMHLVGSGKIASSNPAAPAPGVVSLGSPPSASSATPIQKQPMTIQLQLGAKDQLAHLLNRVGVLGQNVDPKGYNLMTQSFTIGGTPANPDSSQLWQILGAAAARAAAGAFLK